MSYSCPSFKLSLVILVSPSVLVCTHSITFLLPSLSLPLPFSHLSQHKYISNEPFMTRRHETIRLTEIIKDFYNLCGLPCNKILFFPRFKGYNCGAFLSLYLSPCPPTRLTYTHHRSSGTNTITHEQRSSYGDDRGKDHTTELHSSRKNRTAVTISLFLRGLKAAIVLGVSPQQAGLE